MIIFVTGKSGSGKSTFSKLIAKKLKYKYIDVDSVGHKVYDIPEIMERAKELFGNVIFDNETFNRKKLGQIVFSERHSDRVKEFSDLTWKYMEKMLDNEIIDNSVVDWILLPHTKYWKMNVVKVLVYTKDDEKRFKNLCIRDGVSEEYLKLRDMASIEYNISEFDYIFENTYDENDMNENVDMVLKKLK